jgi:hypothetical protein
MFPIYLLKRLPNLTVRITMIYLSFSIYKLYFLLYCSTFAV